MGLKFKNVCWTRIIKRNCWGYLHIRKLICYLIRFRLKCIFSFLLFFIPLIILLSCIKEVKIWICKNNWLIIHNIDILVGDVLLISIISNMVSLLAIHFILRIRIKCLRLWEFLMIIKLFWVFTLFINLNGLSTAHFWSSFYTQNRYIMIWMNNSIERRFYFFNWFWSKPLILIMR